MTGSVSPAEGVPDQQWRLVCSEPDSESGGTASTAEAAQTSRTETQFKEKSLLNYRNIPSFFILDTVGMDKSNPLLT